MNREKKKKTHILLGNKLEQAFRNEFVKVPDARCWQMKVSLFLFAFSIALENKQINKCLLSKTEKKKR